MSLQTRFPRSRSVFGVLALLCALAWGEEPAADVARDSAGSLSVPVAEQETARTPEAAVPEKKSFRTYLFEDLYPVAPEEYIAKGRITAGTQVSLMQATISDLDLSLADIYKLDGYILNVEAFGAYFLRDAMALGLRAGYNRTEYTFDFELNEDLTDLAQQRDFVSNGFSLTPYLRYYLKIFPTSTFYFFSELDLTYDSSTGLSAVDDGENLDKTRNTTHIIEAGINPGVTIFVMKGFAFETSVGLLGLSTGIREIETNGTSKSEIVTNVINFKINLLALNFSLAYYF